MILGAALVAYLLLLVTVCAWYRARLLCSTVAPCPVCRSEDVLFDTDDVGLCLSCRASYSAKGWSL
jgi:hypothetical protein